MEHFSDMTGRKKNRQANLFCSSIRDCFRLPVIFAVLCLLCVLQIRMFGQNHLNYINYNSNNSRLPHNIIYGIGQDHNNYLWICTDDGLVRFDGSEMKRYEKGFQSQYVIDTDEEHDTLWACAWKSGIYYLVNDSAVFVKEQNNHNTLYYTNGILVFNDLVITHKFSELKIHRFDRKTKELVPFSFEPGRGIPAIIKESPPQFHKTKNHRLFIYDKIAFGEIRGHKRFRLFPAIHPDNIAESPDGTLYFMRDTVIYRMSSDLLRGTPVAVIPQNLFNGKQLFAFHMLPSGNIVLCFRNTGNIYSEKKHYSVYNPLNGETTSFDALTDAETLHAELYTDHEGSLWLGTDGEGLFHIFDPQFRLYGSNDRAFRNTTINCMLRFGNDSLFIGTREGLYLLHNRRIRLADTSRLFSQSNIISLRRDEHDRMLIGFANTRGVQNIPMHVLSGNRFISTDSVYYKALTPGYIITFTYDGKATATSRANGRRFFFPSYIPIPVSDLAETGTGDLVISGSKEVMCFNPKMGLKDLTPFLAGKPLINCMLSNRGLWLGTNQGLYYLNNKKECTHWGTGEGLSNCNIRCMLFDSSGALWIGTQNGLFRFFNSRFTVYRKRDGLIADDVCCMSLLPDGYIAAGSSNGLSLFRIPEVTKTFPEPELLITGLKINDSPADWMQLPQIPYSSAVQVDFTSITFHYPELTRFEYRLNAGDPWIATTNHSIQLTNLAPGKYRLEIRVKNFNTGYSKPVLMELHLLKPWWKTGLFITILLVLSALAVLYAVYRRHSKKTKQLLQKQELAELKLKALQAQLNPHFISNTLNAIQYFILKKDEVSANEYLSRFSLLTRMFLDISRSRYISLRQELELLESYIALEQLRFGSRLQFVITLDDAIEPDTTFIPGLLIQPFIENSITHGVAYLPESVRALVVIHVSAQPPGLLISIDDNGIGREKALQIRQQEKKRLRSQSGSIIAELLETYNTMPGWEIKIHVTDKKDAQGVASGTCVEIRIRMPEKEQ